MEKGTYGELMKIDNGKFVNLVLAQQMDNEEEEEQEEEDPDEVRFVRGNQGRATARATMMMMMKKRNKGEDGDKDDGDGPGSGSIRKNAGSVVRRVSDKLRKSFRRPRAWNARGPAARYTANGNNVIVGNNENANNNYNNNTAYPIRRRRLTSGDSGGARLPGRTLSTKVGVNTGRSLIRRNSTFSPIIARTFSLTSERAESDYDYGSIGLG